MLFVESHQSAQIRESMARVVKGHAVLGEIGCCLFRVPFKEHAKTLTHLS